MSEGLKKDLDFRSDRPRDFYICDAEGKVCDSAPGSKKSCRISEIDIKAVPYEGPKVEFKRHCKGESQPQVYELRISI